MVDKPAQRPAGFRSLDDAWRALSAHAVGKSAKLGDLSIPVSGLENGKFPNIVAPPLHPDAPSQQPPPGPPLPPGAGALGAPARSMRSRIPSKPEP